MPIRNKTFQQTKSRHANQVCIVRKFKLVDLNKVQAESLKMKFVEAKWIYNWLLDQSSKKQIDVFNFSYTLIPDEIPHFDKDHNEVKSKLQFLMSTSTQKVLEEIQTSISSLSTKKKNKTGKIGTLKFKSEKNSIDLSSHSLGWNIKGNQVKIQGIKKRIKVLGIKQLTKYKSVEFANAKLVKKPSGFFINITCFIDKDEWWALQKRNYKNKIIGIDFGCQTALTFSDGTKLNASVEEPGRLKHLQRLLMKKQKGSNNRHKLCAKIRREYEKLSNKKNDLANKIVAKVLQENELIIMQDEQINSWKKKHGKKIQHGILGRVKTKLLDDRHKDQVFCLSRWIPTTKFCSACGRTHDELTLFDRTFKCDCGVKADRDIHAAQNMIWFYDNIIGVERTKFKLLDFRTALENYFSGNAC